MSGDLSQPGSSSAMTTRESAPSYVDAGHRRRQARLLEVTFQAGLAGVFIANALVALLQPTEFTQLVDKSAPARMLSVETGTWLGPVICVNDLLLGVALLAGIWTRRGRLVVLAWAGAWLFAVAAIKLTSLDAFRS
jgi:hypothetical protein